MRMRFRWELCGCVGALMAVQMEIAFITTMRITLVDVKICTWWSFRWLVMIFKQLRRRRYLMVNSNQNGMSDQIQHPLCPQLLEPLRHRQNHPIWLLVEMIGNSGTERVARTTLSASCAQRGFLKHVEVTRPMYYSCTRQMRLRWSVNDAVLMR